MARTMGQQATEILDAVKAYLDQTARKHDCVGFDCKVCSVNGDRYAELEEIIFRAL